jgi:hypothetical protein
MEPASYSCARHSRRLARRSLYPMANPPVM